MLVLIGLPALGLLIAVLGAMIADQSNIRNKDRVRFAGVVALWWLIVYMALCALFFLWIYIDLRMNFP